MRNLNYICRLVQMDLDNYTSQSYQKYLQYAIMGYRKLQLKVEPKVSVHYFTPNSAGLAPLPPDFEFYTKVAMIIGGQAFTLTYNERIPLPRIECGIEVAQVAAFPQKFNRDSALIGGWFNFIPHYRAGNFVGEFYSLGGGWNSAGYFRIDWKNHQIVITGAPRTEYCMEYVSTGADDGGTLISTGAIEPLRQYVHSQLIRFSNASLGEKQMSDDRFREALDQYKDQIQLVTIDDFIDICYSQFQSSVKGIGGGA